MDTLITLKRLVFDLLTYYMESSVDRIPYGPHFNLKCKFKLIKLMSKKNKMESF